MRGKPVESPDLPVSSPQLLGDIRQMIEETRSAVAATVNIGLTMLYWRIGRRIGQETLKGARADYGKQIVATMSQQLSWSHFRELLPLEKPRQRDFYAEMCRVERWSVRTLRQKIASMLYERTALSKKPDELAKLEIQALRDEERMTPDLVFRDPYLLDFLGLKDTFQEKDLEAAILRQLEAFIMELGTGFTFVARQKRITMDQDDFYLDLLFFHRDLRRLVALELKLDKFRPDHKGQMELYLRWLDKHERKPGEDSPLGIILCAGKKTEQIELLELSRSGIHVAEYLTALPPKDVLKRKLHEAIAHSRLAIENRGPDLDETGETSPAATVKKHLKIGRKDRKTGQDTRKPHRRDGQ